VSGPPTGSPSPTDELEVRALPLPGCLELRPPIRRDARGAFVKFFERDRYAALGLPTSFAEVYSTTSTEGVLRGLHCQLPPYDYHKLVQCLSGTVVDVLLDLRRGSPTYGKHVMLDLDAATGAVLSIPTGVAHGFYVPAGEATMLYHVTAAHAPVADSGIRWDSAGIAWPTTEPILSARDRRLPTLDEFASPFQFDPWPRPRVRTRGG